MQAVCVLLLCQMKNFPVPDRKNIHFCIDFSIGIL